MSEEYQEQQIHKLRELGKDHAKAKGQLCQECGHELEVDTMSADLICYKCGLCWENIDE